MFRVAILSIGDELCIGQVVNTNASFIAEQCSGVGALVTEHRVIGDEAEVMLRALDELQRDNDCVIMTGGLGPTHDDITKDVLCQAFHVSLVEDEGTVEWLRELFARRNRELTDRNKAQALRPENAQALKNELGSAPGLFIEHNSTMFFALPGVPAEMKKLIIDAVLPLIKTQIQKRKQEVRVFKTLLAVGIAESDLADLLPDLETILQGQQLAFLPSYTGIRLRISVSAATAEEAAVIVDHIENSIRSRAGRFILAGAHQSMIQATHSLLMHKSKTLALAESCTGGMLGMMFTDNPGSSQYFLGGIECYSNESKLRDCAVDPSIIVNHGAVSRECVEALAVGVRERFQSDYAISISGIAGPDGGTPDKPIGTVWIAVADQHGVRAKKFLLGNDRHIVRERACGSALAMLYELLAA